jgi:hypothetical protein
MPAVQSRLSVEPLRSRLGASFDGTYQTLGSPLDNPIRMFKITNNTASDVIISYDGVTDGDFIPAMTFMLIDITANKVWDCQFCLPRNTQVYVKAAAALTGSIYLSTYYAT